jgi:NAD(P)-dependent dehydrogenase (short-subunit alcohol dehydrogenase family)
MSKKRGFKLPDELDFLRVGRLPQRYSDTRMDGKVCVITGTTSGIGHLTALRLARAGAHLVMVVRNPEKGKKVSEEVAQVSGIVPALHIADYSRLSDVRRAGEEILAAYPKIDVLINNAGLHMTTRKLTADGHEMAFGVNHLASFLLTKLLLPRMVESAPSRIIDINSEGHRFGKPDFNDLDWSNRRYKGLAGYGAAKTSQLMTVWEFNDQLAGTGVTINAMHPGAVQSAIGTNNGKLYNLWSKWVIQPMLRKADISAEAIYYLASSPEMEGVSGRFFNLTNEEHPAPHAMDRVMGREMYRISMELTGFGKEVENEI